MKKVITPKMMFTQVKTYLQKWSKHFLWPLTSLSSIIWAWGLVPADRPVWYRRISNWPSLHTSALKPRLSVSSHNTDARQTIERLIAPIIQRMRQHWEPRYQTRSAQINVNFVILGFVYQWYDIRCDLLFHLTSFAHHWSLITSAVLSSVSN